MAHSLQGMLGVRVQVVRGVRVGATTRCVGQNNEETEQLSQKVNYKSSKKLFRRNITRISIREKHWLRRSELLKLVYRYE